MQVMLVNSLGWKALKSWFPVYTCNKHNKRIAKLKVARAHFEKNVLHFGDQCVKMEHGHEFDYKCCLKERFAFVTCLK